MSPDHNLITILDAIERIAPETDRYTNTLERVHAKRAALIRDAVHHGATLTEVSYAAGISRQRVAQIVNAGPGRKAIAQ
jgi:DNA-directed RNA polymerase sigma subunit (sigma70/sigma32)